MKLEEQRALILGRAVIVECEVLFPDFEEMRFEGQSIGDIVGDKSWIGFLKRIGSTSVDLVQEFYVALLDVVDIYAPIWDITVRRVFFQLLADIYGYIEHGWSLPCLGDQDQAY